MKKKDILITGGAGYIGSHTLVELYNSGYRPIVVDDLSNSSITNITGAEKIGMASQVLRNANLQLRCEPPNPIKKVGPWMQTTIEPDLHRRPLDGNCRT